MTLKKIWKRWQELFDERQDLEAPHFDPLHLAAVLIVTQVVIGLLFWLLWTLLVYEGGLPRQVAKIMSGRTPGEGWLAHSIALITVLLIIAGLHSVEKKSARSSR
jgi:heme/copper-type cytochrome/quinol oxidase subunit 2